VLTADVETVPLLPRRRLLGSTFGGFTSIRRGEGTDIASSRPYEPGDHFRTIDWKASARLSAAHGSDEFIVRERHSEEMSRVVLAVDRRPEMALYPRELPWLHKPAAVATAVDLIVASALNQRGLVGYVDGATHESEPSGAGHFWQRPRAASGVWSGDLRERFAGHLDAGFDAPPDTVERSLDFLFSVRSSLPLGSFVFVISDFTAPLHAPAWVRAIEQGWDVIPVIVQDRTWEQSFPEISGVLTAVAEPGTGKLRRVRLDREEVGERRRANEARLASLRGGFAGLDFDAVLVEEDGADAVRAAFLDWAEARLALRGRHW
jgi:uncharacterized protein (DUF58 family)